MPESATAAAAQPWDPQGALILLLFGAMIALMVTRRLSALLALPILGVGVALIGALPYAEAWHAWRDGPFEGFQALRHAWKVLHFKPIIIDRVIGDGVVRLYESYTITMIGGMLAILIKEKKIAETLIKYAAELAGDRPFVVSMLMMLVVILLFSSMGGLGAVIMTATIIFPIMMSLGVSPLTVAGIFLIGLCAGGTINPQSWAFYEAALGLRAEEVQTFALIVTVLYVATGALFALFNIRQTTRFWAVAQVESRRSGVPPLALLSPLVPIVLSFMLSVVAGIFGYYAGLSPSPEAKAAGAAEWWGVRAATFWDLYIGGWDYAAAFFAGLLFVFFTTYQRGKSNVRALTKAIIVGAESVMPAVLLMIGLGIVLQGLMDENVRGHLAWYVTKVVPESPWTYVLTFGLAAPLALYRGPLNVWGLGLGVAGLIYAAGTMTALPVMAIFMSVGAVQGVCDPTNTQNIWIASFIGEDVMKITKKMLPWMWGMAVVGLILAALMFRAHFGEAAHCTDFEQREAQTR